MPERRKLCILGGGASGVGLLWCLARSQKQGLTDVRWDITLLHDGPEVGGHSQSMRVEMAGQEVRVDLGVQAIAPTMYPAIASMLRHSDFASVTLHDLDLRLAMAFPPVDGKTPYWGNFGEYQSTDVYQAHKADARAFQELLAAKSLLFHPLEVGDSIQKLLADNADKFQDAAGFQTYILDPYLSIMNGYGSALLGEVLTVDLAPMFDLGLASFTEPGRGFARFANGSQEWVKQMEAVASGILGAEAYHPKMSTPVEAFYPTDDGPRVEWKDGGDQFDCVVSTLDMRTLSQTLSKKNPMWKDLYEPRVGTTTQFGTTVWDLEPGYCMLHQDPGLLAPGIPGTPSETLQFTGYWAVDKQGQYDITLSFTTWIASNLMGIPVSNPKDDWYLTMWGYIPDDKMGFPLPKEPVWHTNWVHGMWLPTFFLPQKRNFHPAQSASAYHSRYDGQEDTGIFFAGNNLTMDSEEGALMSALAIAKYAFGIDAMATLRPDGLDGWKAWTAAALEFEALYAGLMFPPKLPEFHGLHEIESLMKRFAGLRL